ncbi:MAG: hypothetical protein WAV46_01540 [Candidatus Moraniibacteriota bacterium]
MQSIDPRAFQPESRTKKPTVLVPTISVERLTENEKPYICVQWFGEAACLPGLTEEYGSIVAKTFAAAQFLFLVPIASDAYIWVNHPERFQVISLGQAKDWPNQEAVIARGNPEEWILYVTATHYATAQPSGDGPPAFAIPLNVMLGDGMYGIITPRKYADFTVAERAAENLRQMASASR